MSLISSAVLFMGSFYGKPLSLYDILLNWDNISYSLVIFVLRTCKMIFTKIKLFLLSSTN